MPVSEVFSVVAEDSSLSWSFRVCSESAGPGRELFSLLRILEPSRRARRLPQQLQFLQRYREIASDNHNNYTNRASHGFSLAVTVPMTPGPGPPSHGGALGPPPARCQSKAVQCKRNVN